MDNSRKITDTKTRRLLKGKDGYAILTYDPVVARQKIEVRVIQLDIEERSLRMQLLNIGVMIIKKQTPVTACLVTSHVSFMFFGFLFLPTDDDSSPYVPLSQQQFRSTVHCRFERVEQIDAKEKQRKVRRHLLDEL
jgi:hypothetical protein